MLKRSELSAYKVNVISFISLNTSFHRGKPSDYSRTLSPAIPLGRCSEYRRELGVNVHTTRYSVLGTTGLSRINFVAVKSGKQ